MLFTVSTRLLSRGAPSARTPAAAASERTISTAAHSQLAVAAAAALAGVTLPVQLGATLAAVSSAGTHPLDCVVCLPQARGHQESTLTSTSMASTLPSPSLSHEPTSALEPTMVRCLARQEADHQCHQATAALATTGSFSPVTLAMLTTAQPRRRTRETVPVSKMAAPLQNTECPGFAACMIQSMM